MKHYVLSYKSLNIGDEIQSIAAIELLKKNGIDEYFLVERDRLHEFNEDAVLILNGWFTPNVRTFPPGDSVRCVVIGFHCANKKVIESNIDFFKRNSPIGCRDQYTLELCMKHDIPAYLSKCLTLTLPKYEGERNGKYLVDFNTSLGCTFSDIDSGVNPLTHNVTNCRERYLIPERFERANELLNLYRSAEIVYTSRLHCTLPCRAFHTPVRMCHEGYSKDNRFSGMYTDICGDRSIHKTLSFTPPHIEAQKQKIIDYFSEALERAS